MFLTTKFFLFFGILTYISSMLLAILDKTFELRWITFYLWIFSIISFSLHFLRKKNTIKTAKKFRILKFLRGDYWLLLIIFLAILSRFFLLSIYPHHSIGDELRDGGWDAMRIATGELKNIFFYGRYESHGLLVPTISSYFYHIFGNSSMTFRAPAAIIGVMDIVVVSLLVRKFIGKKASIFSALVLISLPLHLYYSRTEIVVIFSSFFTTLILFFFCKVLQEKTFKNFALLGLVLGIALNLHASVRTVVFLTILVTIFLLVKQLWRQKKEAVFSLLIFIAMIFVGFGPRLLFTPSSILFHTKTVEVTDVDPYGFKGQKTREERIKETYINYPKSLMVYIYEPTTSHFADHKPVLTFILAVFFIIGLVLAVFRGNQFTFIIGLYALILPFTNSSITDWVNADHRLAPLFPIAAILTGFGISEVIKSFKSKNYWYKAACEIAVISLVLVVVSMNIINFFNTEPASFSMFRFDRSKLYQDFMATQLIKRIQSDKKLYKLPDLCIMTSDNDYQYFEQLHIKEQFYFFTPSINTTIRNLGTTIEDGHLYISPVCEENILEKQWRDYKYCNKYEKFVCPPDGSNFTLSYPI